MSGSINPESPRPRPIADSSEGADSPGSESVLAGLGKATWSEEESVSYETAVDSISQLIGAYSGLIDREEASPDPDAAKIATWRQSMVTWSDKRRTLSPADPQVVLIVRREAADLLRSLSDRR